MRLTDLDGKSATIWGLGREGQAAARLVLRTLPNLPLTFIDENPDAVLPESLEGHRLATTPKQIEAALAQTDILIKSPGVSLYHPQLEKLRGRGGRVTSLFNLWCSQTPHLQKIAVTGTKGKSTTASLLTHVLNKLGRKAITLGNIGTPVSECPAEQDTLCVIEVSSYQAADFESDCTMGLLVSLYPEHLNWHGTLERYYADKANLLAHCQTKIITAQAQDVLAAHDLSYPEAICADDAGHFHFEGDTARHGPNPIGNLTNAYLARPHNRANVCAVLAACTALGLAADQALAAMDDFKGLPHRQQEFGRRDGVLYVDDSISTTPQSAIAAMEIYQGQPLTLIAGGQDRGIDYTILQNYLAAHANIQIILLGEVGKRLAPQLKQTLSKRTHEATTMDEAVLIAQRITPNGGLILLSPAAPSYDMFKDFTARADAFLKAAGF